ncbi:MAG: CpaF family protein [Clostridiales bacterium]|jgi:pilus assembly protein CpaF|nr:CpaF family protein [Clostridiales bacterium]
MGLLERLEKQKVAQQSDKPESSSAGAGTAVADEYSELKEKLHDQVIEYINAESPGMNFSDKLQEDSLKQTIDNIIGNAGVVLSRADRARVVREVYDDVVGLGPLEPLLQDPDITEIMVNGPYNVYVERRGKIERTSTAFQDADHVMTVINRITSAVGRRIDEASPMVDARLPDGSRVNAIIPPIALTGPTITIRKFSKRPLQVSDLIRFSSVSSKMMNFLEACVRGRLNIIVSGGTGSGKTTLLSVLSAYIPDNERIVTIEDAAELQLQQNHVVTLESRPPNIEGCGQITIRDLVRNALRMRPDRIIVGEVRSGETLDMLQAMNTGHDGSLTTAHANSPRDLLSRLETMVLMSGMEMPVKAIREQIASALDVIVHQARLKDGSRKIVNITEVVGMEGDTITLQDLYVYKPEGLNAMGMQKGSFVSTGIRPGFAHKLSNSGILVRDDWFTN